MIRWRIIREKTLRLGVALLASIVVRASFPDGTVGLELVDEMLYSAAFRVESPLPLSGLAFLVGWIGFGLVLETHQRTVPRTVCGAVLSVAAAWALAPVCSPFPPLAMFLCWLACPESLYFPRRYAKGTEGKGDEGAVRFHISLEMVVAFCALAGLEISMVVGACQVAAAASRPALGWVSLAITFRWRNALLAVHEEAPRESPGPSAGVVKRVSRYGNGSLGCIWLKGIVVVRLESVGG